MMKGTRRRLGIRIGMTLSATLDCDNIFHINICYSFSLEVLNSCQAAWWSPRMVGSHIEGDGIQVVRSFRWLLLLLWGLLV